MNLLCKLFAGSYENLWKAIIRPSRDKYTSKDLGPYKFELNSKYYKRTDLIITNKRQHKLKFILGPFLRRTEIRKTCLCYIFTWKFFIKN